MTIVAGIGSFSERPAGKQGWGLSGLQLATVLDLPSAGNDHGSIIFL